MKTALMKKKHRKNLHASYPEPQSKQFLTLSKSPGPWTLVKGSDSGIHHMSGSRARQPISALVSTLRSVRREGRTWASVLFDQALVSGTNFLTTVLIARLLGKQQLGLYVLAYSIVVVLLEVQNSFIASPYTMNCSRLDGPAQARYTGSAFALTIGLAGVATAVLLAGRALFPVGLGDPGLRIVFLNLALIVAPLLAKEFARRACFAHFRTREVLLLDGLVSLIQIGGLFLLAKLGSPSVRSVYWLISIASGTAVVVWIMSWRNRTVITLAGAFHTLRTTWSFGTWVLTGNLALVLSQQISLVLGVLQGARYYQLSLRAWACLR